MIIDVGIHFWECHQLVCDAQGGGGGGSLSLFVYIIQGREETYQSAYVRTKRNHKSCSGCWRSATAPFPGVSVRSCAIAIIAAAAAAIVPYRTVVV